MRELAALALTALVLLLGLGGAVVFARRAGTSFRRSPWTMLVLLWFTALALGAVAIAPRSALALLPSAALAYLGARYLFQWSGSHSPQLLILGVGAFVVAAVVLVVGSS